MAAKGSRDYGRLIPCPWAGRKPYPYRAWCKIRFQALSLWAAHRADVVINFGRTDYLWALLRTRKPLLSRFGNPIGPGASAVTSGNTCREIIGGKRFTTPYLLIGSHFRITLVANISHSSGGSRLTRGSTLRFGSPSARVSRSRSPATCPTRLAAASFSSARSARTSAVGSIGSARSATPRNQRSSARQLRFSLLFGGTILARTSCLRRSPAAPR